MPQAHTSTQNPNGHWNVHGVPIFGSLPAGARKNKEAIGREWMTKAVARAQLRNAEGYQGPAHVNHTGDTKVPAGQFLPNRVGKYVYEGQEIDAIFADLVNVPDSTYQRLKRGELPFRSVEVFDWDKPEINELALLETDTPFFRFGWHGIGREILAETLAASRVAEPSSPALAFCAAGAGGVALFAFKDKGEGKDDDDDDESESDEEDGDDKSDKKPDQHCRGASHMGAHCTSCPDHKETAMPVDEKDTTKDPDGAQMAALSANVVTLTASNADLAAKLAVAETKNSENVARLAALEAVEQGRQREHFVVGEIARARKALPRFNFSPLVEEQFREKADGADRVAATARVDKFIAFCKTLPQDPPSTFAAAVGRDGYETEPPEVAKFREQGLDAFEAARDLVPKYHAHVARGGSDLTLKDFLTINVPLALKPVNA